MADVRIKVSTEVDSSPINKADKATDRLAQSAQNASGKFSGLRSAIAPLGGLLAGIGIMEIGKSILQTGSNMEQARVSFTTFLGSAEKANAVLADLQQFANVTPFDNESVTKAGKVLTAFGIQAKDLIPTLTSIGDISAGTGKDFNELASIFGKAKVAGTLFGEDINQLSEAGVPIIAEFAKQFGVAESEVKKMASESKITFANLEQAFKDMTAEGSMFGGLMEEQAKTIGGKYSTALGTLQGVAIKIFDAIAPALGAVLDSFIQLSNGMLENMDTIVALGKAIGAGAVAFGVMTVAVNAVSIATKAYALAQGLLNAALMANPIGLIIGALALLVAGLVYAYNSSEAFRNAIDGLYEGIKFVVKYIGDVAVGVFEGFGKTIRGTMDGSLSMVKEGANDIKKALSFEGFGEGLKNAYASGAVKMTEQAKAVASEASGATGNASAKTKAVASSKSASKGTNIGVKGTQPKVITVNIAKILENYTVNTTNIKENMNNIRQMLAQELVAVVRDAEIAID